MRRFLCALAIPALVVSVLVGGAAAASAEAGGSSVTKLLGPPKCC